MKGQTTTFALEVKYTILKNIVAAHWAASDSSEYTAKELGELWDVSYQAAAHMAKDLVSVGILETCKAYRTHDRVKGMGNLCGETERETTGYRLSQREIKKYLIKYFDHARKSRENRK